MEKLGLELLLINLMPTNNEINKNLNFFIGISKTTEINIDNNAFLEVVKIIIYMKLRIKIVQKILKF